MVFVSDSMLVFQIHVGGVNKVVEFSERSIDGLSCFRTDKEDVAEAIRRHKFFRIGKIRECGDNPTSKPFGKSQGTVAAKPAENAAGTAAEESAGNADDSVMEFTGFSQLKSYLRKTYKDDPAAKTLKTPKSVSEFAKAKGLSYRFIEA